MNDASTVVPVIAIDGPTASGKGTIAARVASYLGYNILDSGILYRLTALLAVRSGVSYNDVNSLTALAAGLKIDSYPDAFSISDGEDIRKLIREEEIGLFASLIGVHQSVRNALVAKQHAFRRAPGLVADGRDMGSIIFPDSLVKIFVTANIEIRVARRYKQLKEKGFPASIHDLSTVLKERDNRDVTRAVSPLVWEGVHYLDTSEMTVNQAVETVLHFCRNVGLR